MGRRVVVQIFEDGSVGSFSQVAETDSVVVLCRGDAAMPPIRGGAFDGLAVVHRRALFDDEISAADQRRLDVAPVSEAMPETLAILECERGRPQRLHSYPFSNVELLLVESDPVVENPPHPGCVFSGAFHGNCVLQRLKAGEALSHFTAVGLKRAAELVRLESWVERSLAESQAEKGDGRGQESPQSADAGRASGG